MDPLIPHEHDEGLRELRWRLAAGALFLVAVTLVGVVGYRIIDPDAGWVNAFYMTAISLTTVGFGEIIDLENNPGGRIFTALLILVGMGGVVYFVSTATAFVLEGQLGHVFWRRRMEKRATRLRDHLVVCGSGATALYTAAELRAVQRDVVVVVEHAEAAAHLQRELPDVPFIIGDPADDEVLRAAGVQRAAGIVACTESDKENLVVTLSARQLNPRVRIVARISEIAHEQKVRKVGADAVVSPNYIGGLRLASELIRPTVVSFLDVMLRDPDTKLRIDEIRIPDSSSAVGRPLGELELEKVEGALLLAVRTRTGEWSYNPPRTRTVEAGEVLIFLGSPWDLNALCDQLQGAMVARPVTELA